MSGERQFDSTYDLTVLYDRVASARDAAACEKRATAQRWRTGAYSRFTSIELEDATRATPCAVNSFVREGWPLSFGYAK